MSSIQTILYNIDALHQHKDLFEKQQFPVLAAWNSHLVIVSYKPVGILQKIDLLFRKLIFGVLMKCGCVNPSKSAVESIQNRVRPWEALLEIDKRETRLNELSSELGDLNSEMNALRKEKDAFKTSLEPFQDSKSKAVTPLIMLSRLNKKVSETRTTITAAQKHITVLRGTVTELTNAQSELEAKKQRLEVECAQLQIKLNERRAALEKLSND